MNIAFFIAGTLALLGAVAHLFMGTRETLLTKPADPSGKVQQSWYQAFGAWHLISLDAALLAAALFWLSFNGEHEVLAYFIVIWMLGWTMAWIATLVTTEGARAFAGKLPQWALFLAIGLVTLWGIMG